MLARGRLCRPFPVFPQPPSQVLRLARIQPRLPVQLQKIDKEPTDTAVLFRPLSMVFALEMGVVATVPAKALPLTPPNAQPTRTPRQRTPAKARGPAQRQTLDSPQQSQTPHDTEPDR